MATSPTAPESGPKAWPASTQALPQDSLAAATNPAATALVGDRLDVGLTWFQPDRDARIQGSGAGADGHYDGNGDEHFVLPDLGYSRTLSPRLSWGIAIHGNGGMNTSYKENPFAAFGSTGEAGVDFAQLFVTPSLAFQPVERHALGIAVTYTLQRFEGKGLDAFDNPFFSAEPGSVTDNGHDNAHGWGLSLGWIGQVHEDLSLGLSWSSRIDTGEFDDYAGLFADQGGFDVPEHYGAGFSWQATDDLTLAGDWQRIQYSETNSVGNELAPLLAGVQLGSDNGPGFGWDDVDVFKLGGQYALGDTLRAARRRQPRGSADSLGSDLLQHPGAGRDGRSRQRRLHLDVAVDRRMEPRLHPRAEQSRQGAGIDPGGLRRRRSRPEHESGHSRHRLEPVALIDGFGPRSSGTWKSTGPGSRPGRPWRAGC
ncbi:MAG: outer membrane protein transport protein [Gammaproteobacteria bacterium]|nr:outer membrane protein transport protein [Gammaproteobacteria bacterium]